MTTQGIETGLCPGTAAGREPQGPHVAEIYANGKCRSCYMKDWRASRPPEKRKKVRCQECGELKPHAAHGLCGACNMRQWREQTKEV